MEVEMKIRGLMMDPVTNMPIVVLKETGSETVLPIWVGIYEANAIAKGGFHGGRGQDGRGFKEGRIPKGSPGKARRKN